MNLLRLREIWRIEGLDNKLLVAGCWSLVGTDNGYAHISEARCPPQRASALAGDPGCGAPGRIRAGSPSVLHPTLRKSAKDEAPELFTSHPSHKTRRMGHPSFLHPTLRTKREGWGTRCDAWGTQQKNRSRFPAGMTNKEDQDLRRGLKPAPLSYIECVCGTAEAVPFRFVPPLNCGAPGESRFLPLRLRSGCGMTDKKGNPPFAEGAKDGAPEIPLMPR